MCVVCMKQGGGAGGIFVSFPCTAPPPPFLMTFPLVLVEGGTPHCPGLWVGGELWDGGCRLQVRLTGHQYINVSLSYTPWQRHEKRVQGHLGEEDGPLLRSQED